MGDVLIKAFLEGPLLVKADLGKWKGLSILSIGPKGGKIVGYRSNGKPIYAGSSTAESLAATKTLNEGQKLTSLQTEKAFLTWLLDLGIDGKISKKYIRVDSEAGKLIQEAFGIEPKPSEGGTVLLSRAKLAQHMGEPLKPADEHRAAWNAHIASGQHERAIFPEDLSTLKKVGTVGSHGVWHMKDPEGKSYYFKPGSLVIAQAESAATKLGKLILPESIADSRMVTMDTGEQGVLLEGLKGDVFNQANHSNPPIEYLKKYRTQVLQHQIIDWLTSNHDPHAGNFLADGKRMNAIDKGQAWKWLGKDKLDPCFKGPSGDQNPSLPIYCKFWKEVKTGNIDSSDFIKVASETLAKIDAITDDQFKDIALLYAGEAAKGNTAKQNKLIQKMLARKHSMRADFEKLFTEQFGVPVTIPKDVTVKKQTPIKGDLPTKVEAPKAVPEKATPGWPITKAATKSSGVTVHVPGEPPPTDIKWPKSLPGPGYSTTVKYKGKDFEMVILEATKASKGKPVFLVRYPDGNTQSYNSANKAGDSLMLWDKGLSLDMTGTEKKAKGISLGSKVFKFKEFEAELANAHSGGELSPSQMTPAQLEQEKVVPEKADVTTALDMLHKQPDGVVQDWGMLPHGVKEFIEAHDYDVGPDWPAALVPGHAVKVTSASGDTLLVAASENEFGMPVYHFWIETEPGKLVMEAVDPEPVDTGYYDLQNNLSVKALKPMPGPKDITDQIAKVEASVIAVVDKPVFQKPAFEGEIAKVSQDNKNKVTAFPNGTKLKITDAEGGDSIWKKVGKNKWTQVGVPGDPVGDWAIAASATVEGTKVELIVDALSEPNWETMPEGYPTEIAPHLVGSKYEDYLADAPVGTVFTTQAGSTIEKVAPLTKPADKYKEGIIKINGEPANFYMGSEVMEAMNAFWAVTPPAALPPAEGEPKVPETPVDYSTVQGWIKGTKVTGVYKETGETATWVKVNEFDWENDEGAALSTGAIASVLNGEAYSDVKVQEPSIVEAALENWETVTDLPMYGQEFAQLPQGSQIKFVTDTGKAYLFVRTGENWESEFGAKVLSDDGMANFSKNPVVQKVEKWTPLIEQPKVGSAPEAEYDVEYYDFTDIPHTSLEHLSTADLEELAANHALGDGVFITHKEGTYKFVKIAPNKWQYTTPEGVKVGADDVTLADSLLGAVTTKAPIKVAIKKTDKPVVTEPLNKPQYNAGPLPVGTSVTVKKKFQLAKQLVELQALPDGKFKVTILTSAGEISASKEFNSLSAASDWVWVNQKGYNSVSAYKKKTGKNKVPSGGGWKFWGINPKAPEAVVAVPVGKPAEFVEVPADVPADVSGFVYTPEKPNEWELQPKPSKANWDTMPVGTAILDEDGFVFVKKADDQWAWQAKPADWTVGETIAQLKFTNDPHMHLSSGIGLGYVTGKQVYVKEPVAEVPVDPGWETMPEGFPKFIDPVAAGDLGVAKILVKAPPGTMFKTEGAQITKGPAGTWTGDLKGYKPNTAGAAKAIAATYTVWNVIPPSVDVPEKKQEPVPIKSKQNLPANIKFDSSGMPDKVKALWEKTQTHLYEPDKPGQGWLEIPAGGTHAPGEKSPQWASWTPPPGVWAEGEHQGKKYWYATYVAGYSTDGKEALPTYAGVIFDEDGGYHVSGGVHGAKAAKALKEAAEKAGIGLSTAPALKKMFGLHKAQFAANETHDTLKTGKGVSALPSVEDVIGPDTAAADIVPEKKQTPVKTTLSVLQAMKRHPDIQKFGGSFKVKYASKPGHTLIALDDKTVDAAAILHGLANEFGFADKIIQPKKFPKTNDWGAFMTVPSDVLNAEVVVESTLVEAASDPAKVSDDNWETMPDGYPKLIDPNEMGYGKIKELVKQAPDGTIFQSTTGTQLKKLTTNSYSGDIHGTYSPSDIGAAHTIDNSLKPWAVIPPGGVPLKGKIQTKKPDVATVSADPIGTVYKEMDADKNILFTYLKTAENKWTFNDVLAGTTATDTKDSQVESLMINPGAHWFITKHEVSGKAAEKLKPKPKPKPIPKPKKTKEQLEKEAKQKAELEAKAAKAKEVAAWAEDHKVVSGKARLLGLAYLQSEWKDTSLYKKVWARQDDKGNVLLGSDDLELGAKLQEIFGKTPHKVKTPLGDFYKVTLAALKKKYPVSGTVQGPDGKDYPVGTKFDTKTVEKEFEEKLKEEPGFVKIVESKTDPDQSVIKCVPNTDEGIDHNKAIAEKYKLKPIGEPILGNKYAIQAYSKKQLSKTFTEEVPDYKVPEQPPVFIPRPVPSISYTGLGGGLAENNREELGMLNALQHTAFGRKIRFGKGGFMRDHQINVRKVKDHTGKLSYEFTGKMATFNADKAKLQSGKMSFRACKQKDPNTGYVVPNIDADGVCHEGKAILKAQGEITYHALVGETPDGTSIEVVKPGANSRGTYIQNFFRVRVPVDEDVEGQLAEAFTMMGQDADQAMGMPDDDDERMFIKSELVKMGIGGLAYNNDSIPYSKFQDEEWLDEKLKKYDLEQYVEGATIQNTFQGKQSVVIADQDKIKEAGNLFVYSSIGIGTAFNHGKYRIGAGARLDRYITGFGEKGASAADDEIKGGGSVAFLRIGREAMGNNPWGWQSDPDDKILAIYHPRTMQRTDIRAYDDDAYGKTNLGSEDYSATYSSKHKNLKVTIGSNEIDFENGISTNDMAGICCPSASKRKQLLDMWKKEGIEEINGIPIEDFVVVYQGESRAQLAKKVAGLKEGVLP